MAPISDDEKKKIIIGILSRNAKTGCQLRQLNAEFREITGQQMTPTKSEAITLLNGMSEVVCENGVYHSASQKSKHIVKLVEQQHTKDTFPRKPNFRPTQPPYRPNNSSFSSGNRQIVSYSDWDGPSTSNNSSFNARKIQDRRKSMHVPSNLQQQDRPKRRMSCVGDRDETIVPKAKRYRSKSPPPPQRSRNEHDDRWTSRQPNGNDRSRPPRSPSPRLPRNRRQSLSRTRHSPSPCRRRRSRSRTSRSNSRQSPSSPNKRARHSPIRYTPQRSPIPSTSSKHISPSPDRKSHTSDNSSASPKRTQQPTAIIASTPLAVQSKPVDKTVNEQVDKHVDKDVDMQMSTNLITNAQPKKPKKFKFTVIGDGYMFYLMHDMQGELKTEMPFCSHNKTIAEAIDMVEIQKDRLQQRKIKVLISIGATDLRNNRSFGDLKRDFTTLFLRCDELGLKPLVTTILCIDSPEHKQRADMFNKFLMENFENVVDMQQVGRYGLANVMLMTHNRNVAGPGNHMELGRLQQLILNV